MAKPHNPSLASPTGFACWSLKPALPEEIATNLRHVDVLVLEPLQAKINTAALAAAWARLCISVL